jgi:acyl-CoA hydrolase
MQILAYFVIDSEFGIVNLKGKCVAERAKAIIGLAHPDFREDLERQAYEKRLIPRAFLFVRQGTRPKICRKP